MSDTPRTDAAVAEAQEYSDHWKADLVKADFARQLERELWKQIMRAYRAELELDRLTGSKKWASGTLYSELE
jgi:hypothetical protein